MSDEGRNDQNFLLRVIKGDRTWIYCYNTEIKQQSFQRLPSPNLQKAWDIRLNMKSVLVIFFGCEGIVYQEFVSTGQVVNPYYC
jgi:hypothetical protein